MEDQLIITREVKSGSGLRVVVRPATYRMGMLRTVMLEQARKMRDDNDQETAAAMVEAAGLYISWPALTAATVEHEGFDHWPLTPDELLDLPETFCADWEQAVFALNPQWVILPAPSDGQKKALNG